MRKRSSSKNDISRFGTFVFSGSMLMGIFSLSFGLVSCGGGGGDTGGVVANAPTIFLMTAIPASGVGIIASSGVQPLTIYGTNFASGTSVTITNGMISYPVSSTNVVSSSTITTNVTIASVPNDNYVTVTLQPPSGNSVNGILGVAHAYRTLSSDIQTIFTDKCAPCHSGASPSGGLDMSSISLSASNLINNLSLGCPQNLRVTAGDPRRASNVLLDLVNTTPNVLTCNVNRPSGHNHMPPSGSPALSTTDIEAIIGWIALGAY